MFGHDFARRIGIRPPTKSKARYLNLLPRFFERLAEKIHRLWLKEATFLTRAGPAPLRPGATPNRSSKLKTKQYRDRSCCGGG